MAGRSIGTIFAELDLDPSRYVKSQKRLLQDATATTLNIEANFKKLGIKSAAEFDLLRAKAENAFNRIKNSNQVTADDIIRAERAKTETLKRLNEQQYGTSKSFITKLKDNWLAATAVITASIYAIRKAWDIVNLAAQSEQAMASFKNLADSYGVNANKIILDLKRASAGTIDTINLVQKAGTAMLFGIDPTKISKLMEIARATSRITGQTVSKAFEDIALAVGRQSKKILDNLGILVSVESANEAYAKSLGKTARDLTDVERRQAFLNATLIEGEKMMARLGTSTRTTAEMFQSFGAFVENAKVLLGQGLIEVIKKVTIGLSWLGIAFNTIMADMASFFSKDLEAHFRSAVAVSEKFIKEIENLKQESSAGISRIGLGGEGINDGGTAAIEEKWQRDMGLIAQKQEAEINAITEHNNNIIELEKELQARSIQQGTEAAEEKLRNYIEWSNRDIAIEQQHNAQMAVLDRQAAASKISIVKGLGTALLGIVGAGNKAIFVATQAFDAAMAIISGYAAGAKALAEVPYPWNLAVSAQMIQLGYLQAAAIAATTIGTLATSGSGTTGGGTAISPMVTTSTNPIAYTPETEQEPQKGTINIYVEGAFVGSEKALAEYLSELISDNVEKYDIRLVASHSKKAESLA